jgi:putative membrane protein
MKTSVSAFLASFAAASLLMPSAWAQADQTKDETTAQKSPALEANEKPTSESDFVTKAAKRTATELKFAQLGVSKAQNPKVKELAQMLEREYTSAHQEIKRIADKLNIKLDETPAAEAQEKARELAARTGREFDTAFLKAARMCQKENIEFYEAGKALAKNAELTAHINTTLPALKARSEKVDNLKEARDKDAGDKDAGPATDPASPDKK